MNDEPSDSPRKLRLKKVQEALPTHNCPSCGNAIRSGDIICGQCGYNTATKMTASAQARAARPPIPFGKILYFAILIVIIAAFAFGGTFAYLAFIATDTDAPKLRGGESARIALADGKMVQGVINRIGPNSLVIVSAPAKTNTIELAAIDPLTRIRCDAGFKTAYLLQVSREIVTFKRGINPVGAVGRFCDEMKTATKNSKPPFTIEPDAIRELIDEQSKLEIAALAKNTQTLTTNAQVEIRRATGQIINGKITGFSSSEVAVTGFTGIVNVPFLELDTAQRLALDASFREQSADLRAIKAVRQSLKAGGFVIPAQPVTDEESAAKATAIGDPGALAFNARTAFAKRQYSDALAFAETAASLESPEGMYLLGYMLYYGFAQQEDANRGLGLIREAALHNLPEAQRFLKTMENAAKICPKCGGQKKIKCTKCGGYGMLGSTSQTACPQCSGSGRRRIVGYRYATICQGCNGTGRSSTSSAPSCPTCNGSGFMTCPTCNGSGARPGR